MLNTVSHAILQYFSKTVLPVFAHFAVYYVHVTASCSFSKPRPFRINSKYETVHVYKFSGFDTNPKLEAFFVLNSLDYIRQQQ